MKKYLFAINCFMFRVPVWAIGYIIGRAVRDLCKGYNDGKIGNWNKP